MLGPQCNYKRNVSFLGIMGDFERIPLGNVKLFFAIPPHKLAVFAHRELILSALILLLWETSS